MKGALSCLFGSFSQRLGWFVLFILLIFSFSVVILWYQSTVSYINNDFSDRQDHIDSILNQSVTWIDRGLVLYEMQFTPQQKQAMDLYLEAYEKSGRNVSKLNLISIREKISTEISGTWDLYIINNEGVVIDTTFERDKGLDFKIWPDFYDLVSDLRINGSFIPDRIVKGHSNTTRKFAYQGTPDGLYLFEVSRSFEKYIPDKTGTSYNELTTRLLTINTDIVQVDLFNSQIEIIANKSRLGTWEKPDNESLSVVSKTLVTGDNYLIIDSETGNHIRYTYLPISETGAPSEKEMNIVSRVVYSDERVDEIGYNAFINFLVLLIAGGIIAVLGAFIASRFFTGPLNHLVEDIDIIASGNLDHKVRPSCSTDLQHIETAVTGLVTNLKLHLNELQKREEELISELEKRCRAEENYKRLIESAHDAIFILQDGIIISCNAAACRLIGRETYEIIGRELHELSPECQSDGIYSTMKIKGLFSRIAEEGKCSCEWNFNKADLNLVETEANMSAVLSDGNVLIMGIFRDVTAIHVMQKREAYSVAQIEENLVKFAEINDQIRNPLTVITMMNDLEPGVHHDNILTQIRIINSLINEADSQYAKTDKVRIFLKKHYGMGQKNDEDETEV